MEETRPLAPQRGVTGLQLCVAVLLAELVLGLNFSYLAPKLGLEIVNESALKLQVLVWYFAPALFAAVLAWGFWMARAFSKHRLAFTVLAVVYAIFCLIRAGFAYASHSMSTVYPYDVLRWVNQIGLVLEVGVVLWVGWMSRPKVQPWLLITLFVAALLRLSHWFGVSFSVGYGEWFFTEAPWPLQLFVTDLFPIATVLLLGRLLRSYELSGVGGWERARVGIERYRASIVWRLVLMLGVVTLSFAGAFGQSIGVVKFAAVVGVALALPISIHAIRGLYGLSQQPAHVGGSNAAMFGAALFALVLLIQCIAAYQLPIFLGISKASSSSAGFSTFLSSDPREAFMVMEAARSVGNWLSLIAVTSVLWSLFRVATFLKETELRSSVVKLGVFFLVTAGGVLVLHHLAREVNSRGGAEGLLIFSIGFLIAVIVAIVWYVRVLQRFAAHIEAYVNREQIAEPPNAVARVAE